MTLEQLGSLGEFVAAIATLLTLVYLALQIRRNTAVGRASGTSEHTAVLNELNYTLVGNPDLYELYIRGLAEPDKLEDSEVLKFDLLLGTYLSCMMQTYFLHSEGALADGIWEHHKGSLRWAAQQPGFLPHWQRWSRSESMPFNTMVAEILAEKAAGA